MVAESPSGSATAVAVEFVLRVHPLNGKERHSVRIVYYTSTLGLRISRRCDQFLNGWYICQNTYSLW